MTNPDTRRRREFIAGLRAIAAFYESNPAAWYDGIPVTLNMYVWGRQAPEVFARSAELLGPCTRTYDGTNITVSRKFTDQVTLSLFVPQAKLCRRFPSGKRILPAPALASAADLPRAWTGQEVCETADHAVSKDAIRS